MVSRNPWRPPGTNIMFAYIQFKCVQHASWSSNLLWLAQVCALPCSMLEGCNFKHRAQENTNLHKSLQVARLTSKDDNVLQQYHINMLHQLLPNVRLTELIKHLLNCHAVTTARVNYNILYNSNYCTTSKKILSAAIFEDFKVSYLT